MSTMTTTRSQSALNGTIRSPGSERRVPEKENIFLFIPNLIGKSNQNLVSRIILLIEQLIGYSRIILAISSLYYMPLHPRTCCLLYSISCILDAFDGYAARRLDQS